MGATEVTQAVMRFFEEVLGRTGRVVAVEPDGEERRVLMEVVEESDYMRRLGKSELLGLYEVRLDRNLEVISYTRVGLRDRAGMHLTESGVT